MVESSSDSRTPLRRPSITGRIPILGRVPIQRLGATGFDMITSKERLNMVFSGDNRMVSAGFCEFHCLLAKAAYGF